MPKPPVGSLMPVSAAGSNGPQFSCSLPIWPPSVTLQQGVTVTVAEHCAEQPSASVTVTE